MKNTRINFSKRDQFSKVSATAKVVGKTNVKTISKAFSKAISIATAVISAVVVFSGCLPFKDHSEIDFASTAPGYPDCTSDILGSCVIKSNTKQDIEPNLIPANIPVGITIFGVTGTHAGSGGGVASLLSNMHRDQGTIPWSIAKESVTDTGQNYPNSYASAGYRAVPDFTKDDDGYTGTSITYVNRSTWGVNTCGTTQSTIAARIADCAAHAVIGPEATWDGAVKGNAGQSVWKLVTRAADVDATSGRAREVWRDERTGLVWSSLVSGGNDGKYLNWCKASGSNNITGNPTAQPDPSNYCDNSSYQTTGAAVVDGGGNYVSGVKAVSACFEDGENFFTTTDVNIDNASKAGLGYASSPKVAWRLPTKYDYTQAETDGIRFVLTEMGPNTFSYEWSASVYSDSRNSAWIFVPYYGDFGNNVRNSYFGVRCVGR